MICFPNAKINLGLNIVSKREDGYHNLETIFYPLPIKDALEIIVNDKLEQDVLVEAGLKVDTDSDKNLVMKALQLMRENYEFPLLEVHLLKKIPFGAGLGGGSSDASFMLRLINDTFELGVSNQELALLARELGADCPFFIYNKPIFAMGIGDVFEEINLSLSGYILVLVKPAIFVSTKDAFSEMKTKEPLCSLKEIVQRPVVEWRGLMQNDFEETVFKKHPRIEKIKQVLYEEGAIYASMTGSGSSVFGLFEEPIDLRNNFSDMYCFIQRL